MPLHVVAVLSAGKAARIAVFVQQLLGVIALGPLVVWPWPHQSSLRGSSGSRERVSAPARMTAVTRCDTTHTPVRFQPRALASTHTAGFAAT
jgi:hypothetical protein